MDQQAIEKRQFTWKHYAWLAVWWLSLGYALDEKVVLLGILISVAFFFLTTFKSLGQVGHIDGSCFFIECAFPADCRHHRGGLGHIFSAANKILI